MTTQPTSSAGTSWTAARAEEHLLSLELFGMRFGLERMRRLLTALGSPQSGFRAIHVVGTNGKSSTARFACAILEAHGVRAGAYLSPHLTTFAERVLVGCDDLSAPRFAEAVERAARAAARVERTLDDGERVTQFELMTAAGFWELARAQVEVAVIEAGLGGRWDATNVLDAPVVVLTNVGLEHTRWLGPTVTDIAREKLAVVPPGGTIVCGPLHPEAREVAQHLDARIVEVIEPLDAALPQYQRLNAAVARAAVEELIGGLDDETVARAVLSVAVPGRFQVICEAPLTIVDGAHNPAGTDALAATLPQAVGDRPLVACISILDDKDATGMLRSLLPLCREAVFTSSSNPRALPPATLASLAGQVDPGVATAIERDPQRALERAREAAGRDGAVIATGSIYLVADLLSASGTRRASAL